MDYSLVTPAQFTGVLVLLCFVAAALLGLIILLLAKLFEAGEGADYMPDLYASRSEYDND
jgi:hypothetical protein